MSESDDSSLNSMDMADAAVAAMTAQAELNRRFSHQHAPLVGVTHTHSQHQQHNTGGSSSNPHPVVSGAVTTISLDGSSLHQDRQAEEMARLKHEKLELLRQNVAHSRELKSLREREAALQSDLAAAAREIQRLRLLLEKTEQK